MGEQKQQVSVDINYDAATAKGIGLENIMKSVSANLAYRLETIIKQQGLIGKDLKVVATLTVEEVAADDQWVATVGGYGWEKRK